MYISLFMEDADTIVLSHRLITILYSYYMDIFQSVLHTFQSRVVTVGLLLSMGKPRWTRQNLFQQKAEGWNWKCYLSALGNILYKKDFSESIFKTHNWVVVTGIFKRWVTDVAPWRKVLQMNLCKLLIYSKPQNACGLKSQRNRAILNLRPPKVKYTLQWEFLAYRLKLEIFTNFGAFAKNMRPVKIWGFIVNVAGYSTIPTETSLLFF